MKKTTNKAKGLTSEEIAAMKERIQELNADEADAEGAVLAKISEMPEPDRTMGKRLHALIKATACQSLGFISCLFHSIRAIL